MCKKMLDIFPLCNNYPRLVYKPHSVRRSGQVYARRFHPCADHVWEVIYLGRRSPCASRSLPGTQVRRAASCPCLALLLVGVAWPPALLPAPVVSYTTISPLPDKPAVCLCGPIRQVSPPRELPGTMPFGVRTFLEKADLPATTRPAWGNFMIP